MLAARRLQRITKAPINSALPSGKKSFVTVGSRKIANVTKPWNQHFVKGLIVNTPHTFNMAKFSTEASNAETMEFQAETRKLLDIVTNSIYTDKEVFVRELISNASDALEKYRYNQNVGAFSGHGDTPTQNLEINLITNTTDNTLTIVDNGIGMSKHDLISNLGTIARSGSKQFVEQHKTSGSGSTTDGIIGQFGVGFYSSFMVAQNVTVESMSALETDAKPHRWRSDGTGQFQIETLQESQVDGLHSHHGSKITLYLKDECKEFADADRLKK